MRWLLWCFLLAESYETLNHYHLHCNLVIFLQNMTTVFFQPSAVFNPKTIDYVNHLPTLHCTAIGLTRERFVALGLPSWTHLRTRYWGVFTLPGTPWFATCSWHMVLQKLGNRWKLITLQKAAFRRCSWNRRDVVLLSLVRKITANREKIVENCWAMRSWQPRRIATALFVTFMEFEQLLQGRKPGNGSLFLHCKATLFTSVRIINQSILCSTIQQCKIWGFTALCKS